MSRVDQALRWAPFALLGCYALALAPTLAAPPLGRESWRETMVLEVGRNFCRERAPLWEPRVDARGAGDGVTGTEFPLLPYAQGLFGCSSTALVVVGRVLGLLCALLGAGALYGLVRSSLGPRVAALALALYLCSPLVLYYGRSVMPDMPALALALAGVWALRRGLAPGSLAWIAGSAVALMLGILIKLPVIVFGLPALVSLLELRRPQRPAAFAGWALYAAAAVGPAALWYPYAQHLIDRSGLDFFTVSRNTSELFAAWRNPEFYRLIFVQHAFDNYAFPIATGLTVLAVLHRRSRMPPWLLSSAIAVLVYFFLCGYIAAFHPYYGLPAVPIIATLAAWELDFWAAKVPRWHLACLGVFAAAGVAYGLHRAWHWFPPRDAAAPYEAAKRSLDAAFPPGARVAVFSDGNPRLFWALDRQGWLNPEGDAARWLGTGKPLESPAVLIDARIASEMPYAAVEAALRARPCESISQSSDVEVWKCPR